jgi:cellulose synthase/poly-beta-1,6-N-acetylglucosamine synthase-like glycosyltransferase
MQNLVISPNFVKVAFSKKFDIAIIFLVMALAIYYYFYVSQIAFPFWDSALYLENAQNWLKNEPLEAAYRPPLISWIIAGIWSITGEDWTVAKYIQPIFTLGVGGILYLTLKKHKGDFFAFGVAALTMLNPHVFFWSTEITTEGLSLFFLVLSLYFLKSEKQYNWILAGIAIGLTFGSRYPIFLIAVVLFITEMIVRQDAKKRFFANTLIGLIPIVLLIAMAVYIKSGSFAVAIERDTQLSLLLSPFYVVNFVPIFGIISLLLPVALIFKRTYIDKYNYAFIAWFVLGFLFWSTISENQQERFMIQLTPALYFLTVLAIENIWKRSKVLTVSDLRHGARVTLNWAAFAAKSAAFAAKWAAFFPFRYYLCAFVLAYLSLRYMQHIISIEEHMLQSIFHFFSITYTHVDGVLYAEILGSSTAVSFPIYPQLIFLVFFPTIAIVSRINIRKRMYFLSFWLLCFSAFVVIIFLTVLIPVQMSSPIRHLISILLTLVVGGLIIELSIWRTITIPQPTKIKRILKRSYTKEYLLLLSVLIGSILITIYALLLLDIPFNSPLILYALLTISSISSVSYLLANLACEINRQKRVQTKRKANRHPERQYNPTISFLIPAYNEEQIIGKCIESVDRAAAKYDGKTEIVIVNDGSTDNTEKVVIDSIDKLTYAHGKIFTIPNSGKGFALDYGLKRISGEIVFRMDADSLIDKHAISPMVEHFEDPLVGSVSGFIFPLEATSPLGKAQNVLYASYFYTKRAQEVFDSIIVQPGPSTMYRKDALLKIGGWTHNQFGEDGEISSRIARFGYKSEFEQRSIVYSDSPQTLRSFLAQRSRWSIAYYHSRGRNLEQVKELASPRALVFLHNLGSHGTGFGLNLAWVLIAAAVIAGNTNFFLADVDAPPSFLAILFIKLMGIHMVITASHVLLYAFALKKINRLSDIKYYPIMRFLNIILSMWVKMLATETVLSWSSKWSRYSDEAFKDLRKNMHKNIDSNYPEPVETKDSVLFGKKHSTTA